MGGGGGGGRSRKNSRESLSSRKSFSPTPTATSSGATPVRCRSMKEKQSKRGHHLENLNKMDTTKIEYELYRNKRIDWKYLNIYVEIFLDKKHRGYKRSKTTDLSQKPSEHLLSVDSTIGRSGSQVGGGGGYGSCGTHHNSFRKETSTTFSRADMQMAGESHLLWNIFPIYWKIFYKLLTC